MNEAFNCLLIFVLLLSNTTTAQPSAVQVLLDWKASAAACSPTEALPSWDETTPMSLWEGLTLRDQGLTVTAVNITNMSLCGPLPSNLDQLIALQHLSVGVNNFTGTLPASFSKLTNLSTLWLSGNEFTGSVPEVWSTLQRLDFLGAVTNQLTGLLPAWASQLTRLTTLDLQRNMFTGTVPVGWSELRALQHLSLGDNNLVGPLPESFSVLTQLTTFGCADNALTSSIPASWGALRNLQDLVIGNNLFTGSLPSTFSALTQLTTLGIFNSQLDSTIPSSWSTLELLQDLYLSNNSLKGQLPQWVRALTALTRMDLTYNQLTGTIPTQWKELTSLNQLVLSYNSLTGPFPTWLNPLMTGLHLSNNKFTGPIPSRQFENMKLYYVDISHNSFTGPIPILQDRIVLVNISNNFFTGALNAVPEMALYFNAANNNLTGPIPAIAGTRLAYLNLANNTFQGRPPSLAAPNLQFLDASNNKLDGSLPEWTNHSMTYCDLSNNSLEGGLSPVWYSRNWAYLGLDHNRLSGSLPNKWNGTVMVLLLHNNHLTGCIVEEWADRGVDIAVLALSNNNFFTCNESLPSFEGMLRNLVLLDLDNASLPSKVPLSWVGKDAFNDKTLLNLGGLWTASADQDASWRKSVCITKSINSRLQQTLSHRVLDNVNAKVRREVSVALASLSRVLEEQRITPPDYQLLLHVGLRLPDSFVQPSVKDLCDNQDALLIVTVQWSVTAGIIVLLIAAYWVVAKYRMLRMNEEIKFVKIGRSRTWFQSVLAKPDRLAGMMRIGRFVVFIGSLALYWYDIVMDIQVIMDVWQPGRWPGYVLLGIFLFHHVLATCLLAWRWYAKTKQRLTLLAPLLIPVMPIIDSVTILLQALPEDCLPKSLKVNSDLWETLFYMRDTMEVLLEAIPTAVVQSVVFVIGNNPELGLYLDTQLYLLSAVGSCFKIVLVTGTILVIAANDNMNPFKVLQYTLLAKSTSERPAGKKTGVERNGTIGEGMDRQKLITP